MTNLTISGIEVKNVLLTVIMITEITATNFSLLMIVSIALAIGCLQLEWCMVWWQHVQHRLANMQIAEVYVAVFVFVVECTSVFAC